MPKYTIIKMCNLTPLHIGTGRDNYDSTASDLCSDTLTAALASIRAMQGRKGDLYEFLSNFVLSSAFPFYDRLYFLPRMQGLLNVTMKSEEEHVYRKQLKKVKYIESSLWNVLADGKALNIGDVGVHADLLYPHGVTVGNICMSKVSQRVSVPRDEEKDASPFFFDWHYYDRRAGLYCMTDATGALLEEIVDLFRMLGERGIGTDKSVGGGHFDVETDSMGIATPAQPNMQMLMSLYIPTEEELAQLNLKTSRFGILQRGGYLAGSSMEELRHLRKNSVYMFTAGSVFDTTIPLEGKVVDVRPEWNDAALHPVYRSGRPFVLPVKVGA